MKPPSLTLATSSSAAAAWRPRKDAPPGDSNRAPRGARLGSATRLDEAETGQRAYHAGAAAARRARSAAGAAALRPAPAARACASASAPAPRRAPAWRSGSAHSRVNRARRIERVGDAHRHPQHGARRRQGVRRHPVDEAAQRRRIGGASRRSAMRFSLASASTPASRLAPDDAEQRCAAQWHGDEIAGRSAEFGGAG